MGGSSSKRIQPLLERLAGGDSIRLEEPSGFWNTLLSEDFLVPTSRKRTKDVFLQHNALCESLVNNDTGNFHRLIAETLKSIDSTLHYTASYILEPIQRTDLDKAASTAARGVFMIRLCLAYMCAKLSSEELMWHIEQNNSLAGDGSEDAFDSDIDGQGCDIVDIGAPIELPASPQSVAPTPVKQSNSNNIGDDITDAILRPETDPFGGSDFKPKSISNIYVERLAKLLSYGPGILPKALIVHAVDTLKVLAFYKNQCATLLSPIFQRRRVAENLISGLLKACISRQIENKDDEEDEEDDAGIVQDILSVFSMPWQAATYVILGDDEQSESSAPDFVQGASILLMLMVYEPTGGSDVFGELPGFCDNAFNSLANVDDPDSSGTKISFALLFDLLSTRMGREETLFLLYTLLQRNGSFAAYMYSRIEDFDQLLVPMLKQLYNSEKLKQESVLVILSILLMFSQEPSFGERIQSMVLAEVPWFEERDLTEFSLGNILLIVVIRCITMNLKETQHEFIHLSSLSILANLAPYFSSLKSYSTERLISLFCYSSKQFLKARDVPDMTCKPGTQFYEMGRTVGVTLAIINACLTSRLRTNHNLIYSILVHKDQFHSLKGLTLFAGEVENIDIIIRHFEHRLDRSENFSESVSVQNVLEVIESGAQRLPDDRLKKLPEVKFAYVENSSFCNSVGDHLRSLLQAAGGEAASVFML